MSISRLTLKQSMSYQGLENDVPEELKPAFTALVARLQQNWDRLVAELRSSVPADSSVLPDQTNGGSETTTRTLATSDDLDNLEQDADLWHL